MWENLLFAFIFVFVTVYVGFLLTLKKNRKRKFVTWGLLTMFIFAPGLSWLIGMSVGVLVGDGFAGGAMMVILFPIVFIIGLILLLIGIFKKWHD